MSLRGVIARHGQQYTVIRKAPGVYNSDGVYAESTGDPELPFVASIQPLSGRQLAALPEGQSAADTRIVYTTFELRTRTPLSAPDIVIYKGENWRVIQVSEWEGLSGGPHYVALIARQTSTTVPV